MNKYIALVALGAASFGMLSSFAKIAYGQGYVAAEITLAQATLGGGFLWLVSLLKGEKKAGTSGGEKWLFFAGMGMGVSAYTYYLSVQFIPASLAIVLLMQMTWISIFAEWALFKRKPKRYEFIITAIILVGTVLAGDMLYADMQQLSVRGILYALVSALMYAVYVIATSRLGNDTPVFRKSALMVSGSVTIIFLINAKTVVTSTHIDLGLLGWGSFLALFGTVIPPYLFTKGMPKIGAGLSAVLLTMELPVAILCAHFIVHEPINITQITGIAVMIAAIVYLNLKKGGKGH